MSLPCRRGLRPDDRSTKVPRPDRHLLDGPARPRSRRSGRRTDDSGPGSWAAMYVVIMAGGGGTRLWPLSRQERPKPFLPLVDARTLLQHTVDRIAPLVEPDD